MDLGIFYWFPEIVFAALLIAVVTYYTAKFMPVFGYKFDRIWEQEGFDWQKHTGYWKKSEEWYQTTFEPIQQIWRYQRTNSIFFIAVMRKVDHYDFIGRQLKRPCQVKLDAVFYRHAVLQRLYRIWR